MRKTPLMVGDGPQNGPAVRAFRKKAARTQEDVAGAVGIDQSYLSLIESEIKPASDRIIDAIAAALGVPVDSLLRVARPVPEPDSVACRCGSSA